MVSTITSVEKVAIPEGYKQTEVGVIPENWNVSSLLEIAHLERGKFSARPRNDPRFFNGRMPFIQTGDISRFNGKNVTFSQTLNEQGIKVSRVFPKNTLFFTIAANIGDVAIVPYSVACPDSLIAINTRTHINKYWLIQALKYRKKEFELLATSNAQLNINLEKLNPYLLPVPSQEEQTAIANALSDVDNLIISLETLIAKKSAIKTAAMQQLLTGKKRLPSFEKLGTNQGAKQGSDHLADNNSTNDATQINASLTKDTGQTAPRPGYKQTELGEIPEDWEIVEFGSLVDYVKGYPFKSSEYTSDGARVIRVSDTTFDSIKDDGCVYVSKDSVKKYKKWQLRENDLIFSTVGSKPPMYDSLVGKAVIVTAAHDGSLLNQNAVIIRSKVKSGSFQKLLLNHFRMERYIDHIEIIYRGNANQASITLENLFEFKLPLPKDKKEQTAIANVLSDMDTELDALQQRLSKTQKIKQGMMQELLTGKTRLI